MLTRAAAKTDNGQCVISLFGLEVNTASFAMYTFSLAVLVQALALVSFSSFADHGKEEHFRSQELAADLMHQAEIAKLCFSPLGSQEVRRACSS